jgi:uncharacterized repeat protein (TIGR04076 family)
MLPYKIVITVKAIQGTCSAYKIGDTILVDDDRVEGTKCPMAFHAIFPYVLALQYGADFPWLENRDEISAYCPDAAGLVLFEIRRIRTPSLLSKG